MNKNDKNNYTNFMDKLGVKYVIKVLFAGLVLFVIFNFDKSLGFVNFLKSAVMPLFVGFIIAMVINVPMQFFKSKVFSHQKFAKSRTFLSLLLGVVTILIVFVGAGAIVLPGFIESIKTLINMIPNYDFGSLFPPGSPVFDYLEKALKTFSENFAETINNKLPDILKIISNTLSGLFNVVLGLCFAILMLLHKDELVGQTKNMVSMIKIKKDKVNYWTAVIKVGSDKFSHFIGGQLIEAVLFGCMVYIGMILFKFPMPSVIAVFCAVGNLIPMIGGTIAGFICFVLILALNPPMAIWFLIFIIVLQQIEGVTTYPVIVGKKVGLNGFWVLTGVIIFGKLFGFIGVFFGVPFIATISSIVRYHFSKQKEDKEHKANEMLTTTPLDMEEPFDNGQDAPPNIRNDADAVLEKSVEDRIKEIKEFMENKSKKLPKA